VSWQSCQSHGRHRATIPPLADALAGKVVITVANALKFGKSGRLRCKVPSCRPAALVCARDPGTRPEAKVVVAYNNLPAAALQARHHLGADVLVCGKSRQHVSGHRADQGSAGRAGAGRRALANALIVEGMTALVINLNKRYGGEGSLQITVSRTHPSSQRRALACEGARTAPFGGSWRVIRTRDRAVAARSSRGVASSWSTVMQIWPMSFCRSGKSCSRGPVDRDPRGSAVAPDSGWVRTP